MSKPDRHFFASVCFTVGIYLFLTLCPGSVRAQEEGFKRYTDPGHRFSFDYPATMQARAVGKDEVRVFHPGATLRIAVVAEKRSSNQKPNVKPLLEAIKQEMAKETKDFSVLKEGKHPGSDDDSQGYLVCAYKNDRGWWWVSLVQYFVTKDWTLQLTISDRDEGFKNVLKIIAVIHESFTVTPLKRK